MQLVNDVVSFFLKERLKGIDQFIDNPIATQQVIFHDLINKAKNTEWGKQYDYAAIDSINTFRNKVPLQDYDSLKPFIEKMMKGEQNILCPSKINWFAKSSGTTSDKSKFIPISKESLDDCHYKAGKDFLSKYLENIPDSKLFEGKNVVIGGSHQVNELGKNSFYGDLSAVLLQNMSFLAQWFRTPSLEVALMDEWEEKIEKMAEETLQENVTGLSGVPTWTVVLINKLFEKTGKNDLLNIWPNLELYIHGGVSFVPYREPFRAFTPSGSINYFEVYNACEGFFAFQDIKDANDMLLLLDHGIFYEFLPMAEIEKEDPSTLTLEEVKTNENYALIISTNSGLWRYLIGDTIRFTSIHPYRIQVSGRTKHFINAFGEEVIVDNAENALSIACKNTGAIVSEYTTAPIYFSNEQQGGHEWLIEFDKEPSDLNIFTKELDEALKSVNSDYEAKRYKDIVLKMPLIKSVDKGTFHRWLESKGKLGGQHKVPRLSNDRKYVDEILKMIG